MAKNQPSVKKKPTIKEMASVIITINDKVHEMVEIVNQLDRVLGMYISMKGDNDELNKFITKEMEKAKERYDAAQNGEADKPNLQGDTEGESSGSKGIREKE
jgi:hypothetical protein